MSRYTEKSFLEAVKKMDGYVKCLAPNCTPGQIHGSGHEQPIMTCAECGFKTCFTHMMPWHTGQTCNQYDEERRLRQEDEASERLLAKTAKRCPNEDCGYFITKDGGCDHMTCKFSSYRKAFLGALITLTSCPQAEVVSMNSAGSALHRTI